MSYSDGSVKEMLLDSSIFSQSRCEFRVPANSSVLSNMKLVGLGATLTGAGANAFYSRGAGVVSLIKNIRLMDGANVLSECREVSKQMTFRNINNSNNVNQSFRTPMMVDATSYLYSFFPTGAATISKGYSTNPFDPLVMKLTDNESTTSKGMVVLSDLLPFLNRVEMLDSRVFKNGLRLVIEWETDRLKTTTRNDGALKFLEPVLCVYDVVGDALYDELSIKDGVYAWYERETDQQTYQAVSSATQRFTGFNNKRVLRFMVSKEYTLTADYLSTNEVKGLGKSGSVSLNQETMNISNSSSLIYPRPLNRNDMSRQVVNSFGTCVGYQGFNQIQGTDATSSPDYTSRLNGNQLIAGDLGYSAVSINNEKCSNIEVSLGRVINPQVLNVGNNSPVNVFLFGDCSKIMSVSSGKYTVGYA
jgi:hypothetical protein